MAINLNNSSEVATIIAVAWPIILFSLGSFTYIKFFRKKEKRLFSNIKRPIAILPSDTDSMDHETQLLKNGKLFTKVDLLAYDARSLDLIDTKYRLVIIRYANNKQFWQFFDTLSSKQMPVIIFSKPNEIGRDEITRIQKYSLHTLCNTPLRLTSDVFAIMSTYPERES